MSSAPLCRLEEIEDGTARGFVLGDPRQPERLLVYRKGSRVWGYVNRCPHIGTPLDMSPDRFMDFTERYLKCATHGALFEPETGLCISGPCHGDSLEEIELRVEDGQIRRA